MIAMTLFVVKAYCFSCSCQSLCGVRRISCYKKSGKRELSPICKWSWSLELVFSPTTITNGNDKRGVLRSLPEAWRTNPVWTLGRAAGLVTPVGGENGKERKGGI